MTPSFRYAATMRALRSRAGRAVELRAATRRAGDRARWQVEDHIRALVPGRSVIDVGGMWGIHGAYSFAAERAGAASVTCVDLYATPEFEQRLRDGSSAVRFVAGDVLDPATVDAAGPADVVLCLGVLYHVPDPARLVDVLRQLCRGTLLLETLTTPEVPGVEQAAVYLPNLSPRSRRRYDTSGSGGTAGFGIGRDHDPAAGYANNFWALSPSCVTALLATAGFRVTYVGPSPNGRLRHLFLADSDTPGRPPLAG